MNCQCPPDGDREIILGIDCGSIAVTCGICHYPVDVTLDDLFADDLPLTMRRVIEAENGDETEAIWYDLRLRSVT